MSNQNHGRPNTEQHSVTAARARAAARKRRAAQGRAEESRFNRGRVLPPAVPIVEQPKCKVLVENGHVTPEGKRSGILPRMLKTNIPYPTPEEIAAARRQDSLTRTKELWFN